MQLRNKFAILLASLSFVSPMPAPTPSVINGAGDVTGGIHNCISPASCHSTGDLAVHGTANFTVNATVHKHIHGSKGFTSKAHAGHKHIHPAMHGARRDFTPNIPSTNYGVRDLSHTIQKRIPVAVYGAGQYTVNAQGTPIAVLDDGIILQFQITDSNLVIYKDDVVQWDSGVTQAAGCMANKCVLSFQPDGNLVTYFNDVPTWFTGTGGWQGAWLNLYDIEPHMVIYNIDNQPIWHTPITPPPPPPLANGPSTKPPAAAAHPVRVTLVTSHTAAHPAASPKAPGAPPIASAANSHPSGTPAAPSTPAGDPHFVHLPSPGDPVPSSSDDPHVIPIPPPVSVDNSGGVDDGSGGGDGGGDDSFGDVFGSGNDFGDPLGGGDDSAGTIA